MEWQPVLAGDRLSLRPLVADDWDALYAVAADPAIWAAHPAHDRWQEAVFRAFFADALARGGALAIVENASGSLIGSSQFGPGELAGEVEIGWSFLARRCWGARAQRRIQTAHAGPRPGAFRSRGVPGGRGQYRLAQGDGPYRRLADPRPHPRI
ncbi:GNAT family N-acetyltransferase [Novosphingobium colocasiae]